MSKIDECFTYILSCDINVPVEVRLLSYIKDLPHENKESIVSQLDLGQNNNGRQQPSSIQVEVKICDNGRILGLEMLSPYFECGNEGCVINEKLTFCVKYRDLSETSQLAFTVWELMEAKGRRLIGGATMPLFSKKGRLKTSDHKLTLWKDKKADLKWPSETPGKVKLNERGEQGRLEHLLKKYARGDIRRIDWLDRLTLKEISKRQENFKEMTESSKLLIKLPVFPHCVLHQSGNVNVNNYLQLTRSMSLENDNQDIISGIFVIQDPEAGLENLIENKAAKKQKNMERLKLDRNLKPDVQQRKRILSVLKMAPNKPISNEDKQLLWKFRGSLVSEKIPTALTKFLKCVDWSDDREAKEAAELMEQWTQIDIPNALELLSRDFKNPRVRAHAVNVLETADDEELMFYLLQLVQALRYESENESKLAEFLGSRAAKNPKFGILFHWFLFPDWNVSNLSEKILTAHNLFRKNLQKLPHGKLVWDQIINQMKFVAQVAHVSKELRMSRKHKKKEDLREMFSEHGLVSELRSMHVALPFDPNILLKSIIPQDCSVFASARSPLKLTFKVEHEFMKSFDFKDDSVKDMYNQHGTSSNITQVGDQTKQKTKSIIYKKGDDLRQDQFTVSMFALMDSLLKKENLDLKLTIYRVLPTAVDDGFVEFVESSCALATILQKHRTIHAYLKLENSDNNGPFGIKVDAVNTFVKSCAGYCVMTYILGVGDRHLDNLMLTPDGHLFHIDFGFILGNDPKPFPPPMKLCKEMIEAMGGTNSQYYNSFLTYCVEAYNIIRKSGHLILSLFHLMADSSIPDISCDPEKAMLKIQDRLDLDMDDEAVIKRMKHLINESASALMPQIMEATHKWAQYWR